MKIPFFDKRILRQFCVVLSALATPASIVLLFVNIEQNKTYIVGIIALAVPFIYIVIWCRLNHRQSIVLKINTSEVEIKFGDIFIEQADLKVIPFNEYFDTLVDDNGMVIAESTLNGKYIEKFHKGKVAELDTLISSYPQLTKAILEENASRSLGKKTKYKLGTICVVEDYLLTAFSHFDDNNKAYLEIHDYINCLLNFWNEVDRVYAGRTIAIPVLGSGITRLKGYENILDQELLELIIWTLKVSRVKLTHPSKAKIIVFKNKSERINLLALKDLEI